MVIDQPTDKQVRFLKDYQQENLDTLMNVQIGSIKGEIKETDSLLDEIRNDKMRAILELDEVGLLKPSLEDLQKKKTLRFERKGLKRHPDQHIKCKLCGDDIQQENKQWCNKCLGE